MKLKFKRDSWHRSLQCYVLGLKKYSYYDMPNLCPYFWITIFCLLAIPFVFFYRVGRATLQGSVAGIGWGIEHLIFQPLDRFIFDPIYESQARRMDGIDVYRSYRRGDKAFTKWLNLHQGEANSLIAKYKAEWEKWKKEQAEKEDKRRLARRATRESRRKLAMRIARVMQKTFPFLAVAILSCLSYALFFLCKWLYRVVPWVTVLGIALGIIIVAFACILVLAGAKALLDKWRDRKICTPVIRKEDRGPGPIKRICCWFLGSIFGSIAGVLDFFIQYIKASKENYCPAIEWED